MALTAQSRQRSTDVANYSEHANRQRPSLAFETKDEILGACQHNGIIPYETSWEIACRGQLHAPQGSSP